MSSASCWLRARFRRRRRCCLTRAGDFGRGLAVRELRRACAIGKPLSRPGPPLLPAARGGDLAPRAAQPSEAIRSLTSETNAVAIDVEADRARSARRPPGGRASRRSCGRAPAPSRSRPRSVPGGVVDEARVDHVRDGDRVVQRRPAELGVGAAVEARGRSRAARPRPCPAPARSRGACRRRPRVK